MKKRFVVYWILGIVVLGVIGWVVFGGDVIDCCDDDDPRVQDTAPEAKAPTKPPAPKTVNYQKYNYDFVDENVKNILNRILGSNGKTAFYLPSTGYINVSRGSKYGVAYALNNPNPSGNNYFEFDWKVDNGVVESCGVSVQEGQSWIERGWTSFGKIGEGWIDHMTVYFSFPEDIEPCSVKYNFLITKDGVAYDTKTLEFNLV